jgi:hypothetical protein
MQNGLWVIMLVRNRREILAFEQVLFKWLLISSVQRSDTCNEVGGCPDPQRPREIIRECIVPLNYAGGTTNEFGFLMPPSGSLPRGFNRKGPIFSGRTTSRASFSSYCVTTADQVNVSLVQTMDKNPVPNVFFYQATDESEELQQSIASVYEHDNCRS